jgi:hypothetical protein
VVSSAFSGMRVTPRPAGKADATACPLSVALGLHGGELLAAVFEDVVSRERGPALTDVHDAPRADGLAPDMRALDHAPAGRAAQDRCDWRGYPSAIHCDQHIVGCQFIPCVDRAFPLRPALHAIPAEGTSHYVVATDQADIFWVFGISTTTKSDRTARSGISLRSCWQTQPMTPAHRA